MKKKFFFKSFLGLSLLFVLMGCGNAGVNTIDSSAAGQANSASSAPKQEDAVTIYVTRHGKTIFNTMTRVQGWADTPLTQPGIEVAEYLGKGLVDKGITFDAVYSSDLGRARETAKIVIDEMGQDLVVNENKNLREIHFGKYEGDFDENMWGDAATKLGYQDQADLMKHLGDIGLEKALNTLAEIDETGEFESFQSVRTRMQDELKKIATDVGQAGGKNVLVVTHGVAISTLLSDLTKENVDRPMPNASVSKVIIKDNKFTVESIGDTSYIEAGEKLTK